MSSNSAQPTRNHTQIIVPRLPGYISTSVDTTHSLVHNNARGHSAPSNTILFLIPLICCSCGYVEATCKTTFESRQCLWLEGDIPPLALAAARGVLSLSLYTLPFHPLTIGTSHDDDSVSSGHAHHTVKQLSVTVGGV
jgi:hypothetical protein